METVVNYEKRKKAIRKISFVFMVLLLVLTFFSKTIDNLLLPEVEAADVIEGRINNTILASGTVEPLSAEKIRAYGNYGSIEIKVTPRQQVTKGTVLALVDQNGIEQEIEDKKREIDSLEIDMEKFENDFYNVYEISSQNEINRLKKEAESYRDTLDRINDLYRAGSETKQNLLNAQKDYENAKQSYEESIQIYKNKKTEYNLQHKKMQIDIDAKKSELEDSERNLMAGGEIICGFDGVISAVYAENGMQIPKGQLLFEVIPKGDTVAVKWNLNTEKARLVNAGDQVTFEAANPEELVIKGEITQKEYLADKGEYQFTSLVGIENGEQKSGLILDVSVTKNSKVYNMIVPNSAIVKSGGMEYVYVLKNVKGPLGEEEYAERVKVSILDSDAFNSAINASIEVDTKVVSYSSKPLLLDKVQVKLR